MAKGDGSKKVDKSGTRRCPLCAETVRADAAKCKFCGSTIVAGFNAGGRRQPEVEPEATEAWAEPRRDDVGLAGPAAVAGAMLGFGLGAWIGALPGVLLALGGATVGLAAGWTRDPRPASLDPFRADAP